MINGDGRAFEAARCPHCDSWRRDALTGLLTKEGWWDAAEAALDAAIRRRSAVTVFIIDVDFFKTINDTAGYLAGDSALRSVAELIRRVTLGQDHVGRFGGDEFLALLPDTSSGRAMAVARNIHRGTRGVRIPLEIGEAGSTMDLTVSIGAALYLPRTPSKVTLRELFLNADASLKTAKRDGRDRTCVTDVISCAQQNRKIALT